MVPLQLRDYHGDGFLLFLCASLLRFNGSTNFNGFFCSFHKIYSIDGMCARKLRLKKMKMEQLAFFVFPSMAASSLNDSATTIHPYPEQKNWWKRRVRVRFFLEFDAWHSEGIFDFRLCQTLSMHLIRWNEYKCDYSGNKGDHYVRTFRLDF